MPDWARRERQGDLGWIAKNFDAFWMAASVAFGDAKRSAIVVDTTSRPILGAGHPFGYFPQERIEEQGDEDTGRIVAEYDPIREFVVVLLKRDDRASTYRVGVVPPGLQEAVASEGTPGHTGEPAAEPRLKPPDVEIAAQADVYADWLYDRYPKLRLTYPRMVYQGLPALRSRLTGPDPVLIAVVDNLNHKFHPDLVRYLQGQGFFVERSVPHLAMLPSCTEISKKCLFIGQPEPFSGTAYEKPILEAWESALSGRRIRYLPHIGALRSVKQREHDVYFLNYLPVDEALHEDEQQTGVPHSAAVRQRLRALAGDIRAFAERIGAERNLVLIVIPDHGSTRIPSDAPNPIDRSFYASRVIDKHHRYVTINDEELAALPDNVRFECYVFERERFGLPTNYLAACSTYRFADPGAGIYVHGGLSPEETIVPLTILTPAVVTPKPLAVRLLADEFRYGVKSLVWLELVNSNQYACQNVRVRALTPNVEADPASVGDLDGLSQTELQIEARIRRSAGDLKALKIQISYQFLGQSQSQVEELPVKMKRIMTTTFDLEELL